MTSPLKKTRDRKIEMIRQIHDITFRLNTYPKGMLDQIDFRLLKKLLKNLNELHERAKPYQKEI